MTSDFSKVGYYDLRLEAKSGRLPDAVGYQKEVDRLNRILSRSLQHNVCLSAPSGSGKTALIFAWAKTAAQSPLFAGKKIVLLNAATLQKISQLPPASLNSYQEAFGSLQNCVLIIDSFGEMIYQSISALQNWNTLLKPLFSENHINIILSMQPEELQWLESNKSHFLSHFELFKLEAQDEHKQREILEQAFRKFKGSLNIETGVLDLILRLCKRFPVLGQMPKSAIQLLDEAAAEARSAGEAVPTLSKSIIEKISAEKTGVLPKILKEKIVGQDAALDKVTAVIQRARLGLRNQNRPLGSFLVLGPSGVGKTETAKILAQQLYGSDKHFLRIDMSEFSESHSTARLLGSPAGYVGFEEGGQLTNHFKNHPYSLLLLDEIEKAHPNGRASSARGETVDFTQGIIMATSNLAVEEILSGFAEGTDTNSESFLKAKILPKLLGHFRMEFLNRFDAILIYKPLSNQDLSDIAILEIQKIELRMRERKIKFEISQQALSKKLVELADPRFGARPIKRFIEETCENLITQSLLN